jgi:hypothetical protein
MAQYKKDKMMEKIHAAALAVFATKGYSHARIADIAVRAGVSVGNIYRYYPGKKQIFDAVLPESFWETVKNELACKIGGFPKQSLPGDESFLRLLSENRERMIILFSGSRGTGYESVRTELVKFMIAAVRRNYPRHYADLITKHGGEEILERIYEGLIGVFAIIMKETETVKQLKQAFQAVNTYHLSGITGLLGIGPPPPTE